MKASLDETMLATFCEAQPIIAPFLRAQLQRLCSETKDLHDTCRQEFPELALPDISEAIIPSAFDDEEDDETEVSSVPNDANSSSKKRRPYITPRNVRSRANSLIQKLTSLESTPRIKDLRERLELISTTVPGARIVALLHAFYESEAVIHHLRTEFGEDEVKKFQSAIAAQSERREVTERDTFLLLWLIETPKVAEILRQEIELLPRYSHVLIDEAQYYEPIVLRLLARLAQIPQGTMTIVGDLEQRITSTGGLVDWKEIGLAIQSENVNRLEINYRWSEPVFDFLDAFSGASGLNRQLKRPKRWHAQLGDRPQLWTFETREKELEHTVDLIADVRRATKGKFWTIAVIVPKAYRRDVDLAIIEQLKEYAIPCRWADGEDVKDSVHKVIVTGYDSIVGLEFNAVFVLGVNEILRFGTKDEVQSVWVAVSRAHQFLSVSRVASDPVFDLPAFDQYRK